MNDIQKDFIQKYDLDGGSVVEVHKPFGNEFYFAVATLDGVYPEEGKIAKDNGRIEYLFGLEGEITVTHNGEKKVLQVGESLLINDGDTYKIEGKGKTLVFVKDSEGGTTEILAK